MKRLFWFILVTFCLFCDADSVLKEASLEENYQEFEQFLTRIANRREYFAFYGEEPLHCNEQHILKQAEKLKIPRNLIIHALTNVTERIYLECPVRTNSYGKAFIVTTYDKSPDKLVDLTGDLEYPEFAPWIINFLSDTSHTPIYPVETFSFSYFFLFAN